MTNALNLRAPVDTLAMEFTRDFDAPVQTLFRAHAEPDLVKPWLGPRASKPRSVNGTLITKRILQEYSLEK